VCLQCRCVVADGCVRATLIQSNGSERWRSFRVYGEIVDLYWRRSEVNLALELETCWNELRARTPFPLLCSYEVAPGENAAPICACHETVLAA
jgi:hypothetical protein